MHLLDKVTPSERNKRIPKNEKQEFKEFIERVVPIVEKVEPKPIKDQDKALIASCRRK